MTAKQINRELWRAYVSACGRLNKVPFARRVFETAMARETAPLTAADGTIDGADLCCALESVLRETPAYPELEDDTEE